MGGWVYIGWEGTVNKLETQTFHGSFCVHKKLDHLVLLLYMRRPKEFSP